MRKALAILVIVAAVLGLMVITGLMSRLSSGMAAPIEFGVASLVVVAFFMTTIYAGIDWRGAQTQGLFWLVPVSLALGLVAWFVGVVDPGLTPISYFVAFAFPLLILGVIAGRERRRVMRRQQSAAPQEPGDKASSPSGPKTPSPSAE